MPLLVKIREIIFREPENKNISTKALVVERISCLLFMAYLLSAGIYFAVKGRENMLLFSALFMLLYAAAFYCACQEKAWISCFLINLNTIIWVCIFYLLFGSGNGVQHFFFALILVDLFLVPRHPVLVICGIYAVRLLLYAFSLVYEPPFRQYASDIYLYVLSMLLECAIILFTGIYFTRDVLGMEHKLQKYNDELRHAASTDPLTKVWNRSSMLEHLDKCIKRYGRGDISFLSVAMGDIDFFKRVNDTYGHECGDVVLKTLAKLFASEIKGSGAIARWGGEEFLFLFENLNGDDAWAVLATIQNKVKRLEIPYEDKSIRVTMTFGLAEYDFKRTVEENIKVADDKLYQGKESGRDRIIY